MFTGIVEATGEVLATEPAGEGRRLRVSNPFGELKRGQSVSVDGACLTVEEWDGESFELFLSTETVARTHLAGRAVGDAVNLERALPADGRLDGHFVQGHVDTTAEVRDIERLGEDWTVTYSVPEGYGRYLVGKGSVAVDGISLTVAALRPDEFSVAVIPETYRATNLDERAVGDPVHLEVDVLAKYVERLLGERATSAE